MGHADQADAIGSVAALDDPVRSRLFAHIRAAGGPVTREEAADAVGISRKLAAFHLDKLVLAGLLVAGVDDTRPRRVGRAPKAYQPAPEAVLVSIPQRSYGLLASILLEATTTASPEESADQARRRVATAAGRTLGAAVRRESVTESARVAGDRTLARVEAALDAEGFEPFRPEPTRVRLRNCPFHPMAAREPEAVCGINHAYMCGLLDGLRATSPEAELAPRPGECCVEIGRPRGSGDPR
jgi:predicted ArsR family transcriptional regulator